MADKISVAVIVASELSAAATAMDAWGVNNREYDTLSLPQAVASRKKEMESDIKTKVHDLKVEATRVGMEAAQKGNKSKHIPYKQALAILKRLNCPKSERQLRRWINGHNTPADFTPEKMDSVEAFTAWATIYANREQSKINTNNALRIDNPQGGIAARYR